MNESRIENSQRDGGYEQTDNASALEGMPTFEEHMAEVENTNEESQEEIDVSKYTTSEEARDAIKNLERQLFWKELSSDLVNAMESGPLEETDNYGQPAWMRRFTTGSQNFTWPPERGYEYRIRKMVSDDGQREKIIIKPDFGYTQYAYPNEQTVNVDGFTRPKSDDPFIEETDFTLENNENNKDIPERMNKVLLDLFKGIFYKDNKQYPDPATASNAISELKEIISKIDGDNSLDSKKEKLEIRWDELLEEEEAAEKRKELESKREEVSRIAEKVDNKDKLSIDDLKTLFEEGFDSDELAQQVRGRLGIDEDALKILLKNYRQ